MSNVDDSYQTPTRSFVAEMGNNSSKRSMLINILKNTTEPSLEKTANLSSGGFDQAVSPIN